MNIYNEFYNRGENGVYVDGTVEGAPYDTPYEDYINSEIDLNAIMFGHEETAINWKKCRNLSDPSISLNKCFDRIQQRISCSIEECSLTSN